MNARGTGCILIGRAECYALFARVDDVLRVRMSADDWERLRLPIGARVNVSI